MKRFFASLIRYFRGGQAEKAFNAAVDKAMPVVRTLVKITPTRADDEILAAYDRYQVRAYVDQIRATPADKRGYLLLQLATDVLAREFPELPTHILDNAVGAAVTQVKAEQ